MLSRRIIQTLILLFFLLDVKGQQKPVYECIYRITIPRMPSTIDDPLSLNSNAVIDYKIITNGDWYLMYGKAISIVVENTSIRVDSADSQEDSALIRKPDKFYSLSLKTVQPLIAHHLFTEISPSSVGGKQIFLQKSDDSSTFFLSSKYPPILTPFPHYTDNKHGVVEIKNARFSCSLISEKQIDFDFHRYEETIKKFQPLSKPLGFPF